MALPDSQATPARTGKSLGRRVLAVLLGILILSVGGGYYAYDRFVEGGTDVAELRPGDCIKEEKSSSFSPRGRGGGGSSEPVKVDCSAHEAEFAIMGQRPAYDNVWVSERPVVCTDFDGAETEMQTDGIEGPVLCLGPVGDDPSMSINSITEGECVVVGTGDVHRSDCTAPGSMLVRAVLRGDFDLTYEFRGQIADCADAGAGDSTDAYSWGLTDQEEFDHEKAVCLVPVADTP